MKSTSIKVQTFLALASSSSSSMDIKTKRRIQKLMVKISLFTLALLPILTSCSTSPKPQVSNKQVLNKKNYNEQVPNKNVPNKNVPNKNVPNKKVPNKNVPNKNVPNKKVPNKKVSNKNVPNEQASNKKVSNKNVPNEQASNKKVPNKNVPNEQANTVFPNPQIEGRMVDACVAAQASKTDGSDCSQDGNMVVAQTFCQVQGFSKATDFSVLKREWSNRSNVYKLLRTGEWTQAEGGFVFSRITCK